MKNRTPLRRGEQPRGDRKRAVNFPPPQLLAAVIVLGLAAMAGRCAAAESPRPNFLFSGRIESVRILGGNPPPKP